MNRSVVKNGGSFPIQCPNALPGWFTGNLLGIPGIPENPMDSEDCLYLDVFVPQQIFENRKKRKAPVMVWIHGGGLTLGSKTSNGEPSGLLVRAQEQAHSEGMIFVELNYRVWWVSPFMYCISDVHPAWSIWLPWWIANAERAWHCQCGTT